jgi:hypothetical protein
MTILSNYQQFGGLAFATGYLANTLAYQGATAPHTGKLYSEALLMGINGGIAAGYFAFEYQGTDPHLHFLTRYPFNEEPGMVFERLAIPMEARTTTDPQKAAANVVGALAAGKPAIVWIDVFALYHGQPLNDMWLINPVVVYGFDAQNGVVHLADRARVPHVISAAAFAAARARLSKTRHRMMTIGTPDGSRLPLAVEAGIRACIDIFTGKPPVGAASSWGFAAYDKWIDLLSSPKGKQSWAKMFAPGPRMYNGLITSYKYIQKWYTGGSGARHIYADFLDEAAVILRKPALADGAMQFREAARLWEAFMRTVLPDDCAPLREARVLMDREYDLFVSRGIQAHAEYRQIQERLAALRQNMETGFPLDDTAAAALRQAMAAHIRAIAQTERQAFDTLKSALA